MRASVQRVSRASVVVDGETVGEIEAGLLVYAAAAPDDAPEDVRYVADKAAHLRVFTDSAGKLNLDVCQVGGSVLVVSAFSLLGDARRGRRPSFASSAPGDVAEPLMALLVESIREHGPRVQTGKFAAHMEVQSVNDGPICILLDSRRVI